MYFTEETPRKASEQMKYATVIRGQDNASSHHTEVPFHTHQGDEVPSRLDGVARACWGGTRAQLGISAWSGERTAYSPGSSLLRVGPKRGCMSQSPGMLQ